MNGGMALRCLGYVSEFSGPNVSALCHVRCFPPVAVFTPALPNTLRPLCDHASTHDVAQCRILCTNTFLSCLCTLCLELKIDQAAGTSPVSNGEQTLLFD
jgi:hypothetical protein